MSYGYDPAYPPQPAAAAYYDPYASAHTSPQGGYADPYLVAQAENDVLLCLLDELLSGETEKPEVKPVNGFQGTVAFAGHRNGMEDMQEWMNRRFMARRLNMARLRYAMGDIVDTMLESLTDAVHSNRLMTEIEASGKRTGYSVMGKLGGAMHSFNPFGKDQAKQVQTMEVPEVKLDKCGVKCYIEMGSKTVKNMLFPMLGRGYLNSAGTGCIPDPVCRGRIQWSRASQADPVMWRFKTLPVRVRQAEQYVADHIQVDPNDLKFVLNVEQGICSVLRSLPWQPGDAILFINDLGEGARQAARALTAEYGVEVIELTPLQYPYTTDTLKAQIKNTPHIFNAMQKSGNSHSRIRLALFAEVGYQSGVKISVKAAAKFFHKYGISVLVDGTHAIGNHDVVIQSKGADWYVAGLQSWLYTEPGVAVLVVHPLKQVATQTLTVSYFDRGCAGKASYVRSFEKEFSYQGLQDFANWCSTFQAMQFIDEMCGGLGAVQKYSNKLAKQVSEQLAQIWRTQPLQAKDNGGSMPVFPLPGAAGPQYTEEVAAALTAYLATTPAPDNVNVDGYACPYVVHISSLLIHNTPTLCARFSCQVFNTVDEYVGAAKFIASLQPYTNVRPDPRLRVEMTKTFH